MKNDLMRKVEKISKFASNSDKIRALTGFSVGVSEQHQEGSVTRDLFQLVALLELYSAAYLEADCYFSRQNSLSSVVNPPTDRLICYLQLVNSIKKPLRNESRSTASTSNGGVRSSSGTRLPSSQRRND